MNPEFVLGIVAVLMTVLGGVVSAHAPTKKKQKWFYGAAFGVLGVASVVLIIVQSRTAERAKAQSHMAQEALNSRLEAVKRQTEEIMLTLANPRLSSERSESRQRLRPHKRIEEHNLTSHETTNEELQRRNQLLRTLRNYYILSHDGVSSEMMAGLEWPSEDWINQQLDRYHENWRVKISTDKRIAKFTEPN